MLRGTDNVIFNKVYITNITIQKTVITNLRGEFIISVNQGDVLRITSNRTLREDIKMTHDKIKKGFLFVELDLKPKEIEAVVLGKFKPTGNLKVDIEKLSRVDKIDELKKNIGLPEPISPIVNNTSPVSFGNGGFNLNVQNVYDLFSGELKKKQRRMEYEKMQNTIKVVRSSLEDDYFIKMKIPKNYINNFLEFIYRSENKNLTKDNVRFLLEKYLPIYQKRLEDSFLF